MAGRRKRVLLVAEAIRTHPIAFANLAWTFQKHSYEVLLATPPKNLAKAEELEITARPAGRDVLGSAGTADLFQLLRHEGNDAFNRRAFVHYAPLAARAMVWDVVRIAREFKPDLVVFDNVSFGTYLACEMLGIRAVAFDNGLAPLIYGHWSEIRPELNDIREWLRLGEEPEGPPAIFETLLTAVPKEFLFEGMNIPGLLHYRHENLPRIGQQLPAGAFEGDGPKVYASLGTTGWDDRNYRQILEHATKVGITALSAGPYVAVIAVGGQRNVARYSAIAGPNVKVSGSVSQPLCLDQADVAILHGGRGGMIEAISSAPTPDGRRTFAGTPAVYLPNSTDQFLNSDALQAHRLGLTIPSREATAEDVLWRLNYILAHLEDFGVAMRGMHEQMQGFPSLDEVVADLGRR